MNNILSLPSKQLKLLRYPVRRNEKLSAWDSADEYLLKAIEELSLNTEQNILIINDAFGALTCALAGYPITSISDSYISHSAIKKNLKLNKCEHQDKINIADCNRKSPSNIQLALIKIPKTLALLEYQLLKISEVVDENSIIIAAGKTKNIHNSTLALFEKIIGPTTTSLAWKKSRLIYSEPTQKEEKSQYKPTQWSLENTPFTITSQANVFSRESLDIGARFLIENLPKGNFEQIIDLGCGNGVVGFCALNKYSKAKVSFVDESFMAVGSSQINVENNLPQELQRCNFQVNDCLSGSKENTADLILCNPPFHQQQTLTNHIAVQMFNDAFRVLKPEGKLIIVGNRHLGYHRRLQQIFGNQRVVASNKKFVVLESVKA